ncbi:MAG: sugar ABC transporter permease [Oscillospiraceae bacterium]|nr:sugar ABC transporter permease [Oscillospiraceae bacterium]
MPDKKKKTADNVSEVPPIEEKVPETIQEEPVLKADQEDAKKVAAESDDPRLLNPKKIKEKTPEEIAKEKELERIKLEKIAAKRKIYIEKKLKALDKRADKERRKIKAYVEKELKKTSDESMKADIEYYAKKKNDELEREVSSRRRVIESSSGSRLSYERKKRLYGYGFIALWAVGVLYMFLMPLAQSLNYSFNTTTLVDANRVEEYGMTAPGIHLEWNDFEHYKYAFLTDPDYITDLAASLWGMLPNVSLILVLSLFIAILLNQKFKGRAFMRAIFFLPVLIATGPVIAVINGDIMSQGASGGAAQFSTLFKTDLVDGFMRFLGLYNISEEFTTFVSETTSDIFNLIWKSGIQILIFLAALQQIPVSAKEAASMEGATGWEFFWKITFPTISPMILANLIYTVIDNFSDSQNPVMKLVMVNARGLKYGYSSAIAWIYFVIIALALAIIVAIVSKFVFYQVD